MRKIHLHHFSIHFHSHIELIKQNYVPFRFLLPFHTTFTLQAPTHSLSHIAHIYTYNTFLLSFFQMSAVLGMFSIQFDVCKKRVSINQTQKEICFVFPYFGRHFHFFFHFRYTHPGPRASLVRFDLYSSSSQSHRRVSDMNE